MAGTSALTALRSLDWTDVGGGRVQVREYDRRRRPDDLVWHMLVSTPASRVPRQRR